MREAVLLVRDDDVTRLSSERGPVADARRYPVPADPTPARSSPGASSPTSTRFAGAWTSERAVRLSVPRRAGGICRAIAPAVIEASAGTGKTYLIEHLVVDRLVRGDARIDEMLVVTFTERAAAELVRRIRALITTRAPPRASADDTPAPHAWTDRRRGARERLEAALRGLDVAPISTIHAFCQRVLTEHAFASGRLLAQSRSRAGPPSRPRSPRSLRQPPGRRRRAGAPTSSRLARAATADRRQPGGAALSRRAAAALRSGGRRTIRARSPRAARALRGAPTPGPSWR